MSNPNHNAASLLTREMLTGTMASLSLTHEINKELQETVNGISMGDENLLERVGLFVNRHSAEYRFDKLRDKVAAYIGERKALIEAGNKLLHLQGMQTMPEKADYGLSKCQRSGIPATPIPNGTSACRTPTTACRPASKRWKRTSPSARHCWARCTEQHIASPCGASPQDPTPNDSSNDRRLQWTSKCLKK